MDDPDLRSFVDRSRALIGSTPPKTRDETCTWLVEPFLETLGWQLRSESCLTNRTLENTRLEYVLSIDSIPAVLVAVEPCSESLRDSRTAALFEAMAWTGVDRAIYTNGRDYLLLAGTTDIERLTCRLPSLPDHESSLQHYSRENARQRFDGHSRSLVARRLAIERSTVTESIVEQLIASTDGQRYEDKFESAVGRFIDQLVVSFSDENHSDLTDQDGVSLEYTESLLSSADVDHSIRDQSERRTTELNADELDANTDSETDIPPEMDPTDTDSSASDGEYVVRFFSDRGSVGAIGHSSATEALVQAAEYCLDRGLADVSVPWGPSDDQSETILNDCPLCADGSSMVSPQQLSNDYYLETAGTVDQQATRVEALAAQVGLRAMLTGDWGE